MPDWRITATTIVCDAVADEVTIIVSSDGTARCASYGKYGHPDARTAAALRRKSKTTGHALACQGPLCSRVTAYRDRIMAEEEQKHGR